MGRALAISPKMAAFDLCLAGLYIFTFCIITLRFSYADVGIGVAILGLLLRGKDFKVPNFVWLMCAFVAWSALVSAIANRWHLASDVLMDLLKLVAMTLVLVNAIRTVRQLQFFLVFIVFCFMLYPVRGALLNYFVIGHTAMGRAIWNASYGNPNDLATLSTLAVGIMVTVLAERSHHRLVTLFAGVSLAATLVTIVLTQSRGAVIGIFIGFGLATIKIISARKSRIFLVAAAILAISVTVPQKMWERFAGMSKLTSTATIAEADPEGSAGQRWEIAKTAWRIWLDHPIFGAGLNTYKTMNNRYAPSLGFKDAHNTYLELLAEVGLIGLAIWLAVVRSIFSYAAKARKAAGLLASEYPGIWIQRAMIAFLVAGFFGTYSRLNLLYFVLAIAWIVADLSLRADSLDGPAARLKLASHRQ